MSRFEGKVAIITGGGRGIGAETARLFAAQGGRVVVADIKEALGREVTAGIGGAAVFQPLDVTDPGACAAAVEAAVGAFGGVDYLVNCAIKMAPGALKDLALEDWNTTLSVGLTGTFLMCQAVGRWMIGQERGGAIVNLSSVGGRNPYGMSGAYSTVKGAVITLSEHFAIEWAGHRIRVNCICPGHTETPLAAYLQDPEIKQARADVTPLGRVGQAVDTANGILFLLSEEADYITAATLDIDGGLNKSVMNHMPGRKWD